MAKFVIAGKCECPYFARAEALADKLALNLSFFQVTKIVKKPDEWREFVDFVQAHHGWSIKESPIIWRELVNQGGSGILIGSAKEFEDLSIAYYNESCSLSTKQLNQIADDNILFKHADDEGEYVPPRATSMAIIGGSSSTVPHLLSLLLNGDVFTDVQLVNFYLYDEYQDRDYLNQIKCEFEVAAYPIRTQIHLPEKLSDVLADIEKIIILDILPRTIIKSAKTSVLETRKDWLTRRYAYLTCLGLEIKQRCTKNVKILVAGNPGLDSESIESACPITFDVAVLHKITSPTILPRNIMGLVKPFEQRVKSTLADRLQVRTCDITNVVIWGNVGGEMSIDLSQCKVFGRKHMDAGVVANSWFSLPAVQLVHNTQSFVGELLNEAIKGRSYKINTFRGMSHAHAVYNSMRASWYGKPDTDEIASLVLISKDWYGIPAGIAFAFPVAYSNDTCWSVLEDMQQNEEMRNSMETCLKSVLDDWAVVDPAPLEQFIQKQTESMSIQNEEQTEDIDD